MSPTPAEVFPTRARGTASAVGDGVGHLGVNRRRTAASVITISRGAAVPCFVWRPGRGPGRGLGRPDAA